MSIFGKKNQSEPGGKYLFLEILFNFLCQYIWNYVDCLFRLPSEQKQAKYANLFFTSFTAVLQKFHQPCKMNLNLKGLEVKWFEILL